ncbi:Spx/MgsR family transcriptional regulator [Extensimonas vulgaris]|jgi:Spx/MgsR family transcriptional regulator|uniref:Spx/MgsR family transcriptional regulator n=2 Tax=Extensimonas vulgaris TaxID=1031594 RepID=A0A369AQG3_9BURK|nr:Spx/MgsR family transcriptional regulator [Extensimonas vulgaris]TWI40507.1 Spx/MgsR family transcriptional regulator [Extensimonas vulgaris]
MMHKMQNPHDIHITVYGIPACTSVKKARAWLDEHGLPYRFHDFKKQGVPPERLDAWLHAVGWEKLLNRQGTTWRKLDPAVQASVHDMASARALMLAQPSIIKRPVIEWQQNDQMHISVGFVPELWQQWHEPS